MTEQWCSEKLESLRVKDSRLSTLLEIKVYLSGAPNLESVTTNRLLSSPEIYECLNSDSLPDDSEEYNVASDILSICMSKVSISQSDAADLLERALNHSSPRIKALALNAMLKELQCQQQNLDVSPPLPEELQTHALNALQNEATEVGVPAIRILTIALEHRLDEPNVQAVLTRMLKQGNIVKCRIYELAVNLAKISSALLEKVEFLLDPALADLDNDDILVKVNVLEIFVSLAEQNHGLVYLEKREVFEIISKRAQELDDNPIDQLLVPAIMKFFGKIARIQPQKIIAGYPHMIMILFQCIHSDDLPILPSAFDTFANLSQTQQGKILMEKHYGPHMLSIFSHYSYYLSNLPTDLKIRAFNTLEVVFGCEQAPTPEVNDILMKWFRYVSENNNMCIFMEFCRNPFPDIKVACLNFIRVLCTYEWGIVALKNTAGFVEYLLDRKQEFDKESKYAKYDVIKLLAESNVFDVQTHLQLRAYINEGPYFIQSVTEVAIEGR